MKMRWGYTADEGDLVTRRIAAITGGLFSHVFPIFESDAGEDIYFESSWSPDESGKPDGVRGPRSIDRVTLWQIQREDKRRFVTQPTVSWLHLSDAEVDKCYKLACGAQRVIRYDRLQLAQN